MVEGFVCERIHESVDILLVQFQRRAEVSSCSLTSHSCKMYIKGIPVALSSCVYVWCKIYIRLWLFSEEKNAKIPKKEDVASSGSFPRILI